MVSVYPIKELDFLSINENSCWLRGFVINENILKEIKYDFVNKPCSIIRIADLINESK